MALDEAVKIGSIKIAQTLINNGSNIKGKYYQLLIIATKNSQLEMIKFIMSLGPNINIGKLEKREILQTLFETSRNIDILNYFIDQGLLYQLANGALPSI